MEETNTTPSASAVTKSQDAKLQDKTQNNREDFPRRGRGEFRGRGQWRGRGDGMGRGGAYRTNQQLDADGNPVESSENAYRGRPRPDGETPFRGRGARGEFRGRGRGGSRPNWEEARQLRPEDCASDEEIVELTEQEMALIKETQQYVRKNIRVLNDNEVVRICVDHQFDAEQIKKYLSQYETKDKYKGLKDFEWQEATTRKDKETLRKEQQERKARQAEYRQMMAEREERRKLAIERAAEREERRLAREAKKAERLAQKKEMEEKRAAKRAEKEQEEKEAAVEDTPQDLECANVEEAHTEVVHEVVVCPGPNEVQAEAEVVPEVVAEEFKKESKPKRERKPKA